MDARRPRQDDGESLLEILIALAIMGACFAAILASIGTSVLTSGLKQQQALHTSYVRALAERIEAQPFQACTAGAVNYSVAGVLPAGSPFGVAVTGVEHWSGSGYVASCPAADLLQRITITVTPPDSRAAEPPLVLLKRKP